MRKLLYMLTETWHLIRRERLYTLATIFIFMVLIAFLVYQVAPVTIVTFIYAGI